MDSPFDKLRGLFPREAAPDPRVLDAPCAGPEEALATAIKLMRLISVATERAYESRLASEAWRADTMAAGDGMRPVDVALSSLRDPNLVITLYEFGRIGNLAQQAMSALEGVTQHLRDAEDTPRMTRTISVPAVGGLPPEYDETQPSDPGV